jgi:Tol biopolymer transport system component
VVFATAVSVFAGVAWSGRAVSPARGLIAFDAVPPSSGGSEVFVANLGTGRVRRLTHNGGYDPTWSSDGSQLAFERESPGPCNSDACSQIWRVAADGSHARPLTPANRRCESPAWSPAADRIAYAQWRPSSSDTILLASIYTRTIDGRVVRRLTSVQGAFDSDAAWSPDGRRIAFTRYRNGRYLLYVMNANGSNQQRLSLAKADAADPAWSPDGRRFAIWRTHGPFNNERLIAVLNTDGTGERTLIRDGGDPVWSPDGRFIAFIPDDQALDSGVVSIMRAEGRGRRKLFGGRFTEPDNLDWLRHPSR